MARRGAAWRGAAWRGVAWYSQGSGRDREGAVLTSRLIGSDAIASTTRDKCLPSAEPRTPLHLTPAGGTQSDGGPLLKFILKF